jgi:hypothetical protein
MKVSTGEVEAHTLTERRVILKTEGYRKFIIRNFVNQ